MLVLVLDLDFGFLLTSALLLVWVFFGFSFWISFISGFVLGFRCGVWIYFDFGFASGLGFGCGFGSVKSHLFTS